MKLFRILAGFTILSMISIFTANSEPAQATGVCVPSQTTCATITVTLSQKPASPATVTAKRVEAYGIGDDVFTLTVDPKNNSIYRSGLIANTGNDSPACKTPASDAHNGWRRFNIKVEGSAVGNTATPVDVCYGAKEYKVPIVVTLKGVAGVNGSMSGILNFKDYQSGGVIVPCTSPDPIEITGPNNFKKTVQVTGSNGSFQTDKSLPPGSGYAIKATCTNKNAVGQGAFYVTQSGITIPKNDNKDIGTVTGADQNSGGANTTTPAPTDTTENDNPCTKASGSYSWLLCPAVRKATEFIESAYINFIEPLLQVNPLSQKDPGGGDNGIFAVWKAFVILANVLFVLAFLGIIFGTVLNLDAYTVKKALPRLVVAAIAVQLSFFVCSILIDISNILGSGLLDFIKSSLPAVANSGGVPVAKSIISYALLAFGTLAFLGALALGPAAALLLLGFVISIFVFIVTLLIRQFLITVLVILSPIAIVAWILPNTESMFKKWKDNFLKMLFIYPIISVLIGAAYVVQAASTTAGTTNIAKLVGGFAPMIAFFMMPAVFKMSGKAMGMAGGAVAGIGSFANKKGKAKTQKSYDNSALLKQREDNKLRKNIDLAGGSGFRARNARRKTGFGFATTQVGSDGLNSAKNKLEDTDIARESKELRGQSAEQWADAFYAPKASAAKKRAAFEKAAMDSTPEGADALQKMWETSSDSDKAIIRKSLDKNPGVKNAVEAKAPHMINDQGDAAYENITAEEISKLSGASMTRFQNHVNSSSAGSVARQNAETAFAQIRGSSALKSRMSASKQTILEGMGAHLSAVPIDKAHTDAIEINDRINAPAVAAVAATAARTQQVAAAKAEVDKSQVSANSAMDALAPYIATHPEANNIQAAYMTNELYKAQVDHAITTSAVIPSPPPK